MTISLADARAQLNYDDAETDDDTEIQFFTDAANEWIATQVATSDLDKYSVQLATRFLVQHWWDTQRGPSDAPVDPEDPTLIGPYGFGIPSRVRDILGPFLLSATPPAPVGTFPDAAAWPDPVCG